ncbi:dual specificity protein phosphatase 26-like isoform X3 [Paramormyrops kingsleyae]|uniref:dual specificity protein phosphatase 26-like isoform X3 n=1 Tax=Paramormyrops kingsleyae TaxID=1676925 RepID=UPI000CD65717|nr:dual specificity protein phosphatase 26-like isoform X5 [Paramormyrops kingsleyae]
MKSSQGKGHGYLSVADLENVLNTCKLQLTQIDEVWPNLYIGNVTIAQNRSALQNLGITHILNAAHSKKGSIGDQKYYGGNFVYCGIAADDSSYFDLNIYFRPAADFIHKALKEKDGGSACREREKRKSTHRSMKMELSWKRQCITGSVDIQRWCQRNSEFTFIY